MVASLHIKATTPLGVMDVREAHISNVRDVEEKFSWELRGKSASYVIASETRQERTEWIELLKKMATPSVPQRANE